MRMSRMAMIITLPPVSSSSCLISVLSWPPYSILQDGLHTSYSILQSGKLGKCQTLCYKHNHIHYNPNTHTNRCTLTYSTAHKDTCQVRSIQTAFWQTWGTQIDSCLSPLRFQTHINILSHIYNTCVLLTHLPSPYPIMFLPRIPSPSHSTLPKIKKWLFTVFGLYWQNLGSCFPSYFLS